METLVTVIYNGEYTITNKDGEHRTFRIKTQKDDAKFAPGKRVLGLMTGSDNENSYTGFAFVNDDGSIRVWRSKEGRVMNYYALLMEQAVKSLQSDENEVVEANFECSGHPYTVMLSKRCLRCNRKLTNPESIKRGIGPECANRL